MKGAYYNEIDPYAAQWLRNLVAAGHIAPGDVDERDIRQVSPDDLRGYVQCHFFAGIAGWSLALRLAGWPDDRPLWTGSCPCQPFSAAGQGKAADDERHLWPTWFSLIRECRPSIILGEQVEAAVGWGWLDAVFNDLEAEGYASGAAVLPACSVGAPHIRQRLWFVAHAADRRRQGDEHQVRNAEAKHAATPSGDRDLADAPRGRCREQRHEAQSRSSGHADGGVVARGLADTDGGDASAEGIQRGGQQRQLAQDGRSHTVELADAERRRREQCHSIERELPEPHARSAEGRLGDASGSGRRTGSSARKRKVSTEGSSASGVVGVAQCAGLEGHSGHGDHGDEPGRQRAQPTGSTATASRTHPWAELVWLPCTDGKQRPTQSGIFPLAHGVSARVAKLRAAGNAINPWQAAEFIKAVM